MAPAEIPPIEVLSDAETARAHAEVRRRRVFDADNDDFSITPPLFGVYGSLASGGDEDWEV
jgi:hypothetical protein